MGRLGRGGEGGSGRGDGERGPGAVRAGGGDGAAARLRRGPGGHGAEARWAGHRPRQNRAGTAGGHLVTAAELAEAQARDLRYLLPGGPPGRWTSASPSL